MFTLTRVPIFIVLFTSRTKLMEYQRTDELGGHAGAKFHPRIFDLLGIFIWPRPYSSLAGLHSGD